MVILLLVRPLERPLPATGFTAAVQGQGALPPHSHPRQAKSAARTPGPPPNKRPLPSLGLGATDFARDAELFGKTCEAHLPEKPQHGGGGWGRKRLSLSLGVLKI